MEPRPFRNTPTILTTIFNVDIFSCVDLTCDQASFSLKLKGSGKVKERPPFREGAQGRRGPDRRLVWTLFIIDQNALTATMCIYAYYNVPSVAYIKVNTSSNVLTYDWRWHGKLLLSCERHLLPAENKLQKNSV